MALTQNELSILDLVASDAAYRPRTAFDQDAAKAVLFSYQDSSPDKEFGFPRALLDGLSNGPNSATAHSEPQRDPGTGAETVFFTNWEFVKKFQDDKNGFGAAIYRSKVLIDGKTNYIVALQGSDGNDRQDWFQNLDLARDAWERESSEVTQFLVTGGDGLPNGVKPSDGVIHFTGQSLGGGLAQYAAYDYVRAMNDGARSGGRKLDLALDVSLVTFNGFGAVKGLVDLAASRGEAFDSGILGKAPTYHYGITNDLVQSLGRAGGTPPGGSWHLNGTRHSYVLDFRKTFTTGQEFPGQQNYLHLVDAHRIESGFYQSFANYGVNFETALTTTVNGRVLEKNLSFDYIDTGISQGIGARVAHALTEGGVAGDSAAAARTVAGLIVATGTGPIQETQALTNSIVQALYNSGDINDTTRTTAKLAPTGAKIVFAILLRALGASSPAGWIITGIASVFKFFSDITEQQVISEVNRELPSNQQLQVQRTSVAGDTASDALLRLRLGLTEAARYLDEADKQASFTDDREREVVNLLASVNTDIDAYFRSLSSGPNWLRKSLAFLQQNAVAAGKRGAALVEFNVKVASLVASEVAAIGTADAGFQERANAALTDFMKGDFAKAIANTNAEFDAKYPLDGINPIGTTLTFDEYDAYRHALVQARDNPDYSNIRQVIEQALLIIDGGGERMLLLPGSQSNPIVSGVNPDSLGTSSSSIEEGAAQVYTAYLPYQAGPGGQRMRYQVAGASNDTIAVTTGSDTVQLDVSGTFEVLIPEGQRQTSFVIVQNKNISANTTLTISGTLVDASGNATHRVRTLATVALTSVDEGNDTPQTTYSIFGDQVTPPGTQDAWGNVVGGAPAPGRNDFLIGSPGNDRIEGLGGDDAVNADDGDDYVLGGDGNDTLAGEGGKDRIEGGTGRDFAMAGLDNDLVLGQDGNDSLLAGNGGDDRIYGGTQADEATVFASDATSPLPGDAEWLDGGDGKDRLIGTAYGNVLLGGSGEDVLAGGAGNDFLYGDRDVVITPPPPIVLGTSITLSVSDGNNTAGGADVLFGGGGNDLVEGGVGADTLFGNAGDDTMFGDANNLSDALGGGDFIDGGEGNDTIHGQQGNDALYGGAGDDRLQGDDPGQAFGDDYLSGEDGNDILLGAGGNDVLYGGKGDDDLHGDAFNVPIEQHGKDELYGGEGDDTLNGYGGDDLLDGGAGKDTLFGGLGKDRLLGGAGDDTISGDNGGTETAGDADLIDGGAGNDTLGGQGGDDTIIGGDGEDTIDGGDGNDSISGGAGKDLLFGGNTGADTLDGGDGDDTLIGGVGQDKLFGRAGDDILYGENGPLGVSLAGVADVIDGGAGDDKLFGEGGDDDLTGGDGKDRLEGGDGSDRLDAGDGDDVLLGGAGNDNLLGGSGNDTLDGGAGNDALDGGGGDDVYIFDAAAGFGTKTITDASGFNSLVFDEVDPSQIQLKFGSLLITDGLGDEIHIEGFDPTDVAAGSAIQQFVFNATGEVLSYQELIDRFGFTIQGTPEADQLMGTSVSDVIDSFEGDDVVVALGGDDILNLGDGDDIADAGEGNDMLDAGLGNDTVQADDGDDEVLASDGDDIVFGGNGGDGLEGEAGNDQLYGEKGIDTLYGGEGNDLLDGGIDADVLYGDSGDDTLLGGKGNDELQGGEGDDALDGGSGNDLLDGGFGVDVLAGGLGDDVYLVDPEDAVLEDSEAGYDWVRADFDYALSDNVEALQLTGADNLSGIGNASDNAIWGNDGDNFLYGLAGDDFLSGGAGGGFGNDVLDGGTGADTMAGGVGDDVYYVDNTDDVVVEFGGGGGNGYDVVIASVDYTLENPDGQLGRTVEELDLVDGAVRGTGNELDNFLLGNDKDNILDGGAGADDMVGGAGDDTYYVDSVDDFAYENAGEGNDTVFSLLNFRLPDEVENLVLVEGSDALVAEGNAAANVLTGNSSGNVLDGIGGADTMAGGTGDDVYYVDDAADTVVERADEGLDEVHANVDHTLAASVENLYLEGDTFTEDLAGTGNELDNIIVGNAGANVLSGGVGSDTLDGGLGDDVMDGGDGNDTYYADSYLDVAAEVATDGYDTVFAGADFALGANIEALYLTGLNNAFGDGNDLDNLLVGDDSGNGLEGYEGADVLQGMDGNDWLYGDEGDDVLDGGFADDYLEGDDGDDTYYVDTFGDQVVEFQGQGIDTVFESLAFYSIDENVENATVNVHPGDPDFGIQFRSWEVQGNALDNLINGNDGRNYLSGGDGVDTIDGHAGSDTMFGDSGDDVLYGGDDRVVLGEVLNGDGGEGFDPESVVLMPNADTIFGGLGDDQIDGGSGNDTLHGDDGNDFLYGGDDGKVGDEIAFDGGEGEEGGGGGQDGDGFLGNADFLEGGSGDDVLDGGSGDDEIHGDGGDDVLYGGSDGALNTSNNDYLDGGAGIDAMHGQTGDDTYIVDGFFTETTDLPVYDDCGELVPDAVTRLWTTDTVVENPDEGYDIVYSYADFTVPDNVEEVHLQSFSDALFARGNDGDNALYGNEAGNRLEGAGGGDFLWGGDGDDVLDGGAGDDTLQGGAGDDVFNFGVGAGHDTVTGFDAGFDAVHMVMDLTVDQVSIAAEGDDVVLGIRGTGDRLRLQSWFLQGEGVQEIDFCDGTFLDAGAIFQRADANRSSAADDFDEVAEDGVLVATGNVLDNDSTTSAGLHVTSAGTYAGAYGTLTLAADGSYTYELNNDAVQFLSENQGAQDTFSYAVENDDGAPASAMLRVDMAGANDAPETGSSSGAVTEATANTDVLAENAVFNGGFEFGDAGWTRSGGAAFAGPVFGGQVEGNQSYEVFQANNLVLAQTVVTNPGELYDLQFWVNSFGFSVNFDMRWNGELLATGSGPFFSYTPFGGQVEGTGFDTLEFDVHSGFFFFLDAVSANHDVVAPRVETASGTLLFTDVDASDEHSIGITPQGSDYLGFFDAGLVQDSRFGASGSVAWNFAVEDFALDYLAEGEVLTQRYDITVDDGRGGTATGTVSIDLVGTNDAPGITFADSEATVYEDDSAASVEGAIGFADVDLADAHVLQVVALDDGYAGVLTAAVTADSTGTGAGSVTWTYTADAGGLDFLAEGEELTQYYEVTLDDGHAGGVATQQVAVTLVGVNDAPLLESGEGAIVEDATLSEIVAGPNLLVNGDFETGDFSGWFLSGNTSFTDVDDVTPADGAFAANFGAIDSPGFLAQEIVTQTGQQYVLDFVLRGGGDQGASFGVSWNGVTATALSDETLDDYTEYQFLLTGDGDTGTLQFAFRNDPALWQLDDVRLRALQPQDVLPADQTSSGTLAFGDADLSDSHVIGVAPLGAGYLGELDVELAQDSTGGVAGELAWTFLVSNEALQYLAEGETLVQNYDVSVDDGFGGVATQTITITLAGTNDAPSIDFADAQALVVEDESAGGVEAAGGEIDFSDMDLADSHTASFQALGSGYVGSFEVQRIADSTGGFEGSAAWTFSVDDSALQALAEGETLEQDYLVTVDDGHPGGLAGQLVSVFIVGVNDAPVTAADLAFLQEDSVFTASGNVLANDSDADHDTVLAVYNPGTYAGTYGTLVLHGDGSYEYLRDNASIDVQGLQAGEYADEVFDYLASDGLVETPGSLVVRIAGANDAPVATDDAASLQEDFVLVASGNVLYNDSDVDFDTELAVAAPGTYAGAYGTLTLEEDGDYQYQLNNAGVQFLRAGETVVDSFAYEATDGIESTPASLAVTITGANDAPVANADLATVNEDGPLIAAGNVLANDADLDHDTVLAVVAPGTYAGTFGMLVLEADGSYTYTLDGAAVQLLNAGQSLSESFGYEATDGELSSASVLTVGIGGANDAPGTADDAADVQEDVALTAAGNVLANDSDVDGGTVLTIANAGTYAGVYGTLVLGTDGSYTYTLDNASAGVQALAENGLAVDVFSYSASDGGASSTGTLSVTVAGTNDAPVTGNDDASVGEDLVFSASGNVLGNDRDVDAGSILAVAAPGIFAGAFGTLTLGADGSYTYALANGGTAVQALAEGQKASETFAYAATDGLASSNSALTMTITGRNDAPVVANPIPDQSAPAGTPLTFIVAANTFTDIDRGNVLAYGATQSDGTALPSWLSFAPVTRTFSGTAPGTAGGGDSECGTGGGTTTLNLRVTATDPFAASAFDDFVLNVNGGSGGGGGTGQLVLGTAANDVLTGTACDDVLDGREGGDTMRGGKGSDVYFVDQSCDGGHGNEGVGNGEDPPPPGHDYNQNDGHGTSPGIPGSAHGGDGYGCDDGCVADLVVESENEGTDVVYASVDYTLPANVEEVHLLGCDDLDATGNGLANVLEGNAGDNTLSGGAGADTYLYSLHEGNDTIDEKGVAGQIDTLKLQGVAAGSVRLAKSGNNLVIDFPGRDGRVTIKNWFTSSASRVERLQFDDGTVWDEAKIRSQVGRRVAPVYDNPGSSSYDSRPQDLHGSSHEDQGDDRGHGGRDRDGDEGRCRTDSDEAILDRLKKPVSFSFEEIMRALGQSGPTLSAAEIARRWATARGYFCDFGDCGDDDGYGAGAFPALKQLGIDVSQASGFGYEGSTGENGRSGGMKGFQGLSEGFRRL